MNPFDRAISLFDEFNSQDPNKERVGDHLVAKELLYSQRMTDCLHEFAPDPGEDVRLAVRCQHIGRWQISRNTYPEGKKGYLQWRNKLKDFHAKVAGDILRKAGYGDSMIEQVRFLILKKELNHNANSQLLEDVVCLVFIRHYLKDFADKHPDEKVVDILRKTLKKMSPSAKQKASAMVLDEPVRQLLEKAVLG